MLLIQSLAAVVSFAEAGTGVALSDAVKYPLPFQGRCSHCDSVHRKREPQLSDAAVNLPQPPQKRLPQLNRKSQPCSCLFVGFLVILILTGNCI